MIAHYRPQENESAERANRTVIEGARTISNASGLHDFRATFI